MLLSSLVLSGKCQSVEKDVEHVKVYHESGRYGGWPANTGIWIWGDEILTGFSKGYYKDNGIKHGIDRKREEIHVLARSLDGGASWIISDPGKDKVLVPKAEFGTQRTDVSLPKVTKQTTGMNFTGKGFAFLARMGAANQSTYWYSEDKGKNWIGPFEIPDFGKKGTAARSDIVIYSKKNALLFLTAMKSDGEEGRVMCMKTTDGGKSWSFLSWIGDEPKGYSIMPASVQLSDNELLVVTRDKEGDDSFISSYYSNDKGQTWTSRGRAVDDTGIGNPPAMIKLKDGRVCLIYGYRSDPDGIKTSDIRARLSSDNGKTWSKDYILRNDGSGRDVGYPRVVQRADGKIVVVYYFMDKATGPERYIAASIWTPPSK